MNGEWNSRRSVCYSTKGAVTCSQPLAAQIGVKILQEGGNAVDAAVAVAASLAVTFPCATGIGGDAFMLFWDNEQKKIFGLNGSGRAAANTSLDKLKELGIDYEHQWNDQSVHCVTVPGAAALWFDALEEFGTKKLSYERIFQDAIDLAENGFPVSPVVSMTWAARAIQIRNANENSRQTFFVGEEKNRHPEPGEIFTNKDLANTLRKVAAEGKKGFYEGEIAERIIEQVQSMGGFLTLEDLQNHKTTREEPIHVNYHGVDVYEIPPSGQGITALIALNILKQFNISKETMKHNSAEYLHLVIESLRLAFADARYYIADPQFAHVPVETLLSDAYGKQRHSLIDVEKAAVSVVEGSPTQMCNTVYFSIVDQQGNAVSFINSNYNGFGTAIVPKGCGFPLHNRGHNFSLLKGHKNALEPNKRPYHTIIPGMALKDGDFFASFGVMGSFMQPQGHVQVLLNLIDFGMNPQQALDARRICVNVTTNGEGPISLEDGIDEEVAAKLKEMGHSIEYPVSGHLRYVFGRGQILLRNPITKVIEGGSDPRGDGHVAPVV